MQKKICFIESKIGKKYLIAITGIVLSLFVLAHMMGNMLIFISPKAYNLYGHAIVSNPFLYIIETILLMCFFIHLSLAIIFVYSNRIARPQTYAVNPSGEKETSLTAKTMWAQGLLIFVFTVLHIITFKYGTFYSISYDGKEVRDLYRLIVEVFQQPIYVIWYFVCLVALGFHLSHGISSSIQTLGLHHPKYQGWFKGIGWIYAILVSLGFISQPLYIYFIYKG